MRIPGKPWLMMIFALNCACPVHRYSARPPASARGAAAEKAMSVRARPAAVHEAASAGLADVRAAVAAARSGDTVTVPAGSVRWDDQLVLTKSVSLVGAGPGQTRITSGFAGTVYGDDNYLLRYDISGDAAKSFRVSGFTWDCGGLCEGVIIRNHAGPAGAARIRIDHCEFRDFQTRTSARMLVTWGIVWGVVDNCVFQADDSASAFRILSPYGANDLSWTETPYEFGNADSLYFEDNIFNILNMPITGNAAGRYVMRHNTFNYPGGSGLYTLYLLDNHGNSAPTAGANGHHSGMGLEFYENTINLGGLNLNLLDLRGGKALVYNNYAVNCGAVIESKCREEYSDYNNPPAVHPVNGQPQHVSDFYTWNTFRNGEKYISPSSRHPWIQVPFVLDYGYGQLVPYPDKQFWFENPRFDGTANLPYQLETPKGKVAVQVAGMGVGPLASRPGPCTVEGAGWWSTDESKLYRWRRGAWELYYTPYAYPHPLRALMSD
jgi:hypothetical protein